VKEAHDVADEDATMNEDVEEPETPEEAEAEEAETEEAEAPSPPAWYWGTGRRKTAVARVRVRPGAGEVRVNRKPIESYFATDRHRASALKPLDTTKLAGKVDVAANLKGGGPTGQAEAMLMGLARALVRLDSSTETVLRDAGHLTRDARMVERKKYGRRGARRRFQYSKR
jgi:small subunit ribosomal protein S9